jgi:hypothetical protein
MPNLTRTFTVDELADIDALYAKDVNVLNEVEEVDDHGTSLKRCIFLHDGRHWEIYYSSHGQNGVTWDDDVVTATAVEERQVTVTQWLPVETSGVTG